MNLGHLGKDLSILRCKKCFRGSVTQSLIVLLIGLGQPNLGAYNVGHHEAIESPGSTLQIGGRIP
jgi:hypothetical protein